MFSHIFPGDPASYRIVLTFPTVADGSTFVPDMNMEGVRRRTGEEAQQVPQLAQQAPQERRNELWIK